ncbi:hypothetical protein B0O41_3606 [Propionibacteriaceae bacterium ES.041]|uniref:hypothetical protein n=1 Tax=Enemella evansiae TaxID=2016499 RepID=UPI000B974B3E|nr:hypothetical protein [Enemella evansiae]OYN97110.1 hypothetical protein CGZ96_12665 [Enemella evansiae]PFG68759.1 hypothetical protein B0O41_3606 [Propionibacteriaceae bacterium ES.041]
MNDTDLDRLRAMRAGLDREIEAPDPRLLADLRRSFTAEQLETDSLDDLLIEEPPALTGRASRRQLLLAGLGGAAACGLVVGGVRFFQARQPASPAAPGVPAVPGTPTAPVPAGGPAGTPAPAGYPPGAALPMTRNPLPPPVVPTAVSASPRKPRPDGGLTPPPLGGQEVGVPVVLVFEEFGDEKGSAPDPRAIRRWQDSGELRHTGGGGIEATLRRAEATSYRYFDYGSEQAYKGVPYAGHQETGDRTVLWPSAVGVLDPDPVKLLTETVQGLSADKQRLGVVGYWTIRTVVEKLVMDGPTMLPVVRAAYIRALQRVEGVEVTGANSNPAGGPFDEIRISWMNAIGTAAVGVRFDAATGLVTEFLDQRYLDNRVCMPRETGQCMLQYMLTVRYQPG